MKFSRLTPALLLLLAACSGSDVKDTLGLNKEAPDEFVVVSRPPLVVPPDFDLQPPRPGAPPPHVQTTEQQARDALLGDKSVAATAATGVTPSGIALGADANTDKPSLDEFMNGTTTTPKVETAVTPVIVGDAPTPATSTFLKKLGADTADDNIRRQLQMDLTAPAVVPDKPAGSLFEELMGEDKQEPIVDPAKEAERLRTNKDEDKPVTAGDTPTKDESPKSVLDRIF